MRNSRVCVVLVFLMAFRAFAQESDVFLYIPTDEDMAAFMGMHRYLAEWESGSREVSPDAIAALYSGNVGKKDLNSLQFEAFLVSARNPAVRAAVLSYLEAATLSDPFAEALKKKYAASAIEGDPIRRSCADGSVDEGIDYFSLTEIGVFEKRLALLVFDTDWERVSLDGDAVTATDASGENGENGENGATGEKAATGEGSDSFYLIAGGATTSLTVYCKRHRDIAEESIDGLLASEIYPAKFANWQALSLEPKGILAEAGADRYIVAYGSGPDSAVPDLDCGTYNAYLYDRESRILYEASLAMVISPASADYPARERLCNYFLFHALFRFLPE